VGKPEGKTLLGRLRRRWEYNIKMDFSGSGMGACIGFYLCKDWER